MRTKFFHSLLLQVVLPGAACLATREWACVVALSGMNPRVASQMATGREAATAIIAHVLLLRRWWAGRHRGRSSSRKVLLCGRQGVRLRDVCGGHRHEWLVGIGGRAVTKFSHERRIVGIWLGHVAVFNCGGKQATRICAGSDIRRAEARGRMKCRCWEISEACQSLYARSVRNKKDASVPSLSMDGRAL